MDDQRESGQDAAQSSALSSESDVSNPQQDVSLPPEVMKQLTTMQEQLNAISRRAGEAASSGAKRKSRVTFSVPNDDDENEEDAKSEEAMSVSKSLCDQWDGAPPGYDTFSSEGSGAARRLNSGGNFRNFRRSPQPRLCKDNSDSNLAHKSSGKDRRKTYLSQVELARDLSLPLRILGVFLAFVTVIFLWEFTDGLVAKLVRKTETRLVTYLALSIFSGVCLILSHNWILGASAEHKGTLVPSFAYSLSTLFTAIGSWGVVQTTVDVLVTPKQKLFCNGAAAVISLFCTMAYSIQTKHNVLLDIASCASTLGLHDEDFDIVEGDAEAA